MTEEEARGAGEDVGTVTDADGFQITSNTQSTEELKAELAGLAPENAGKGDASSGGDAGKGDPAKGADAGKRATARGADAGDVAREGAGDAAKDATDNREGEESGSERDEHGRFIGKKVEKRIAKTVWEREEARRKAAAVEAENAELRKRLEALEAGSSGKGKADGKGESAISRKEKLERLLAQDGAPKIDEFDDFQEWTAAVAEFVAAQEVEQTRTQLKTEAEQLVLIDRVSRMAGEGEKEYPGQFVEAMTAADRAGARFHPAVLDVILSEPYGHRLAFELVSHPEIFRQVNEQPTERAALREAFAVLHRLTSASESKKGSEGAANVSKAKRPIQPIGSAGRVNAGEPNEDEETDEEYRIRVNRQEFEQRRMRR